MSITRETYNSYMNVAQHFIEKLEGRQDCKRAIQLMKNELNKFVPEYELRCVGPEPKDVMAMVYIVSGAALSFFLGVIFQAWVVS